MVGDADIPSRVKGKLLRLAPPTIKTETKTFSESIWILDTAHSSLVFATSAQIPSD